MTSSTEPLPVYRPSGRLSWRALPVLLLIGVPAALLFGWLYACVLSTSHWILVSLFITACTGIVIGLIASVVLKFSHSRSLRFNRIVSGVIAIVVLWARWIATLSLSHMTPEGINFATSGPVEWMHILSDFAAYSHSTSAEHTSVGWLAIGWGVEALLMVKMIVWMVQFSTDDPYSETAKAWAKKDFQGELFWPGINSDALLERLEQQGVVALLQLIRATELTAGAPIVTQWWTALIEGYRVESDPTARWLRVCAVVHTRDNDGKITSKSTLLLNGWQVSDADYASVVDHLNQKDDTCAPGDDSLPPQDASPKDCPTPVELAPAVTALETGNFTSAITLAQAHCQHPREEVRADAYRLCALAHARLGHWDDAFENYHALFEIEPTVFNAMQLATTSLTCGELLRGHAWFEKANEINQQSHEMMEPKIRTHFISALEQVGELAAAKPHLDWLANMYRLATTTDDHRLWMHGLPFFGEFLQRSLPILRGCCSEQDIKTWYESMRDDLDENGRQAIDRHLAALTSAPSLE